MKENNKIDRTTHHTAFTSRARDMGNRRMNNPKISVITVCKNPKDTLIKTIESVVRQTYGNIEYIIIDGNSDDGTKKILETYKKNITTIISEKDTGIYNAMNKGISLQTGNIVSFLNAGDSYIDNTVLAQVAEGFDDERVDILYGKIEEIDYKTKNTRIIGTANPDKYYWYRYTVPHPAIFYKPELFIKYGSYDETFRIAADYDLNLRLFFNDKVIKKYINLTTTLFPRGGISTNPENKKICRLERREIYRRHFRCYERLLFRLKKRWKF